MKIESKLILTSKNAVTGTNLYTFVLTYPRMILAEVNTHRMLSRNAASSRAIPAWKQRKRVLEDPFVPHSVGQNQKGMQAGAELYGWQRFVVVNTWKAARYPAVLASWLLDRAGAHKQAANRIIEPWTYAQQVMTCTDLKNFFKLRNHPDAEPHFQIIAKQMQAQVQYVERLFETVNFDSRNPDGSACALDNVNPPLGVYRVQMLRPGSGALAVKTGTCRSSTTRISGRRPVSKESTKRGSTTNGWASLNARGRWMSAPLWRLSRRSALPVAPALVSSFLRTGNDQTLCGISRSATSSRLRGIGARLNTLPNPLKPMTILATSVRGSNIAKSSNRRLVGIGEHGIRPA